MGIVDKAKNSIEKLTGHGKETVGRHTGNADLEAEGHRDQAKGNLKSAGEDVKDAFGK